MNAHRRARLALAALSLLMFHTWPPAAAQTGARAPLKIDEFGAIPVSDLKARLDNFAIAIQNEPAARGYIMVYRSRRDLPGLNPRLLALMRSYLVNERALAPARVVAVDGGEAACLWQEFWLVPEGATPPARPGAYRRDFVPTDYAREFDEYHYDLPGDSDFYETTEMGDSLEAFAAALLKEPRTLGYVIAYPQYYVEQLYEYRSEAEPSRLTGRRAHLDPPGAAAKMLREVSDDLVKKYRIPRSRIRAVNGGHRRSRAVELWIVPRGEHAPVPTPNSFPRRR